MNTSAMMFQKGQPIKASNAGGKEKVFLDARMPKKFSP
jgi:hypothetical protein